MTFLHKAICHCKTCQKSTSSAYTTNVIVPPESFSCTQGQENLSSYTALHETGIHITFYFCKTCGTKIYKKSDDSEDFKGVYIVQAGTLDKGDAEGELGINEVGPRAELWVKNRVGWLNNLEGVRQAQEFS